MEHHNNVNLYFFSTYAQSLSALVGLSATFAVFYYQSLLLYLENKFNHVYKAFSKGYRILLSDAKLRLIRDCVNSHERFEHIKQVFDVLSSSQEENNVRSKLENNEDRYQELLAWRKEFDDAEHTKKKMKSFRYDFVSAFLFGLTLITSSIASITLCDLRPFYTNVSCLFFFFIFAAIVYIFLLVRLLLISLASP